MSSFFLDFRYKCPYYYYQKQWIRPPHNCSKASNEKGICAKSTCPRIAEQFPTFVCDKCMHLGKSCSGTDEMKPCGKWQYFKTGETISEILGFAEASNER